MECPRILFILTRTSDANIIAYAANTAGPSRAYDHKKPVEVFRFKPNAQGGWVREDLNMLDGSYDFGYGVKCAPLSSSDAQSWLGGSAGVSAAVSLLAGGSQTHTQPLTSYWAMKVSYCKFAIFLLGHDAQGRPRAFVVIRGQRCEAIKLHVCLEDRTIKKILSFGGRKVSGTFLTCRNPVTSALIVENGPNSSSKSSISSAR